MKRILPLLLVILMLLGACAQPADNAQPSDTGATSPSGTTQVTTKPDGTTPPTDPSSTGDSTGPMGYVNPLNGQPMAEPYTGRPVAVMLNNIKQAMPQHGVSQADILYEVLAEGGITRCMGIFSDISKVEKVGSIRSARKYFVQLAQGFDAMYTHFGGSAEANQYLSTLKGVDLDGYKYTNYFQQDLDRLHSGYSSEHTWFGNGKKMLELAKYHKYSVSYAKTPSYNMTFDDGKVIVGESANKVTVYFNQGGKPSSYTKSTALTYDKATKTYLAAQHGGDYLDGNTKKAISFRNIVILRAATSVQSDGLLLTVNTTGTGTGYFACNGQLVPIRWSRKTVNDPFTYTLENGNSVTFGVGATYIGVVPTNATVNWE